MSRTTFLDALDLEQFKDLAEFRDAVLASTGRGGMPVVLSGGQVLFTAVSPHETKAILARRVADRIAEEPDLLVDVQRRIETEEPEDWP